MACKQASYISQAADKIGLGVVNNSIDMETDADDLAALDNKNYDCIDSACDSDNAKDDDSQCSDSDNADDDDGSDSDNADDDDSQCGDQSGVDSDDDTYDDVYAFKIESHVIQKKNCSFKNF
jgi:hypothetical protein